jgi:hypothetical protein
MQMCADSMSGKRPLNALMKCHTDYTPSQAVTSAQVHDTAPGLCRADTTCRRPSATTSLTKSATGINKRPYASSRPPRPNSRRFDLSEDPFLEDEHALGLNKRFVSSGDSSKIRVSGDLPVSRSPLQLVREESMSMHSTSAGQLDSVMAHEPPLKQMRSDSAMMSLDTGFLHLLDTDGGFQATPSALAPARRQPGGFPRHVPKKDLLPRCSSCSKLQQGHVKHVCRGRHPSGVASSSADVQTTLDRPSIVDIWDFVRTGAGKAVSATGTAGIAASSCSPCGNHHPNGGAEC